MYAKFRIFLTLFVFVNINLKILNASEATSKVAANASNNDENVALPLVVASDKSDADAATETQSPTDETDTIATTTAAITLPKARARSIADNSYEDGGEYKLTRKELMDVHQAQVKETMRPLKNAFRGVYKSYKSTYMGNGTSAEYKKRLIERLNAAATALSHSTITTAQPAAGRTTTLGDEVSIEDERLKGETSAAEVTEPAPISSPPTPSPTSAAPTSAAPTPESPTPASAVSELSEALKAKLKEKLRKRKRKYNRAHASAKRTKINTHFSESSAVTDNIIMQHNNNVDYTKNTGENVNEPALNGTHFSTQFNDAASDKHYRYAIGPGVNMSFDMLNDIVNVNLDGDNLREIMRGRWLSDNTEEGRGKKYDMVTKVLPLFVLPFLIQSAIVPFLVTKLKLLLVKSILIGKLAIFLLILSAIRNSNKMVQSYEVAPSYWAGEPSRRSELAAASTSTAYNGYRVEGKPAAWIN
ncbi:uncharacterized protein LOC101453157 [Ceratitis capitata]|uniref:uncharacterized protein LOC101453157 n=1 Tax=Ceratitis capitata TaxID=7213 RepID=UPI00032A2B52|nr:uncharacterized protein LOC101453157 [Ceratitis capitata]